jgi:hypothetical protein
LADDFTALDRLVVELLLDFLVAALAVFLAPAPVFLAPATVFLAPAAFLPPRPVPTDFRRVRTLPITTNEPDEGVIVESSPVDHVTRNKVPLTPVTTPSRGCWPTFFEGTWTRSPTCAITSPL